MKQPPWLVKDQRERECRKCGAVYLQRYVPGTDMPSGMMRCPACVAKYGQKTGKKRRAYSAAALRWFSKTGE